MFGRRAAHELTLAIVAVMAAVLGVLGAQHTADRPQTSMPSGVRASPTVLIPTTRVVGLGDSVMSGTACGCDGIPAGYARGLSSALRAPVSAVNLGEGGSTAASTEMDLEDGEIDHDVVASADVLLVIVGANDLGPADDEYEAGGCDASCYEPLVQTMSRHLSALLADLRRLTGPHAQILVGTYWNVFPDGDASIVPGGKAELEWSRSVTVDTNETICRAAVSVTGACVDLASPFFGAGGAAPLLAVDGDHPNSAGVNAIVAQFVAATDVEALARPS